MNFQSYVSMLYIQIDDHHLCWRALRNFATDMVNVENVEEIVGTREAEAAATAMATESGGAVATESGRAVPTESGGAVATESGGAATTSDETVATAGDETAANGEVMYADEGPYTIDARNVEKMVGTTREAVDGDRVRWGRDSDVTGDETGGPRDETGDKTAATGGDERDDGDRSDNVYERRGVRI